jgi:putative PIN family toxin of toxin-antitoxin system
LFVAREPFGVKIRIDIMILHAISYSLVIVLDTDVVVAAFRSPNGASRWLIRSVLRRKLAAAVSVPLLLEYEAVLNRPEHLLAVNLASAEVSTILVALAAVARRVHLSFRWRPLLTDANDDMVLETAINGGAGWIVTFNVRDFGKVGEPFGCRALLPSEAVQEIRANENDRDEE